MRCENNGKGNHIYQIHDELAFLHNCKKMQALKGSGSNVFITFVLTLDRLRNIQNVKIILYWKQAEKEAIHNTSSYIKPTDTTIQIMHQNWKFLPIARCSLYSTRKCHFTKIWSKLGTKKCYFENLHILSASVAYFSVMVDFSVSTSPKWAPEEKIRTNLILRYTSYVNLSCIIFS